MSEDMQQKYDLMERMTALELSVGQLTARLVTAEGALMKNILQFEKHTHHNLGFACVPVSQ